MKDRQLLAITVVVSALTGCATASLNEMSSKTTGVRYDVVNTGVDHAGGSRQVTVYAYNPDGTPVAPPQTSAAEGTLQSMFHGFGTSVATAAVGGYYQKRTAEAIADGIRDKKPDVYNNTETVNVSGVSNANANAEGGSATAEAQAQGGGGGQGGSVYPQAPPKPRPPMVMKPPAKPPVVTRPPVKKPKPPVKPRPPYCPPPKPHYGHGGHYSGSTFMRPIGGGQHH